MPPKTYLTVTEKVNNFKSPFITKKDSSLLRRREEELNEQDTENHKGQITEGEITLAVKKKTKMERHPSPMKFHQKWQRNWC